MRNNYASLKNLLAAMTVIPALSASAGWEQITELPATQAHFITSEGIHLLSDFLNDRKGGIYYSEDKGLTWTHSDVKDYNYNRFYETSEYVFALGYDGRIARSADGGKTWEILNYTYALRGILDDKSLDSCVAYGIVESEGKLYIGDFNGGGVLVSDDYGETWKVTDRQSMMFSPDGESSVVDSFYNLVEFNGQVYAFGALSVWRYNASEDKWEAIKVRSNFMAVSTFFGDKLVCGRAVQNDDPDTEYLVWTEDGDTWHKISGPEPPTELGLSLYVRAIHSDGQYIFTAGPDGRYPDPDSTIPNFPYKFCPDFFYTSDMGETWSYILGLPQYSFPLTLTSDDEYVYSAVYTPNTSNKDSGLWRLPKADLNSTGVKQINNIVAQKGVTLSGKILKFGCEVKSVNIWDVTGSMIKCANCCSQIDLHDLPAGAYIFKTVSADGENSGKFIL